jgi:hypothetical protein|nr:MAG: hypothetical protein [Bacteriophage sp.]UWI12591.1 MAG: hypothetical protein [Bacteriophage sp.]
MEGNIMVDLVLFAFFLGGAIGFYQGKHFDELEDE